ncbi:pre-rRNA 2'-O-ribose RNA methyltransferase FTSJ3 [Phymastichus coffea]|uniref:pre-rRNA 2'-O-ribose RNA methyltransferase FTSJ3 n=1 Tax=Phymastichus coffea TaxID=108790 RepID=UPI00273CA363|nr:pre-rRNA 2'-O-ribose RNA methyltransferase FTSJ3 [Phymastichus coffea]
MGKKTKIGKQRRDKYYHLAKETGYRSRAAFKLIQLNRKFEFLQKSRVCIDLCAAPGGWMQVAHENMPVSSIIVGVDLYPIKPVPGCISFIGDITTDKCRVDLSRELKTWKADVVLNDGAPNVGQNWLLDAYQQATLTLSALKLATQFLRRGGWFITKVFRSKDYSPLIWVFKQLFKKVHATKPHASRDESAEIFVVCKNYIAPSKVDPKFLDPKHVFAEIDLEPQYKLNVYNPEKQKKAKALGYPENDYTLYHKVSVKDFIASESAVEGLQNASEIVIDDDRVLNHKKTTKEVIECCKDIKVLGKKDFRLLMNWWKVLKDEFCNKDEKKGESEEKVNEKPLSLEEQEDLEDEQIEEEIKKLKQEEIRELKRKKKRENKEKQKIHQKLNLKMINKGDEGPTLESDDMFSLKQIKNIKDLQRITDQSPDIVAESDEEEDLIKPKVVRYEKDNGHLDSKGLFYKNEDSELEFESEDDNESVKSGLALSDAGEDEDEKPTKSTKRVSFKDVKEADDEDDDDDDDEKNPLITDLDHRDKKSKKLAKAELFFDRDIFKDIEDERLDNIEIDKMIEVHKKKGGIIIGDNDKVTKKRKTKNKEDDDNDDSGTEDNDDKDSDYDSDYNVNEVMRPEKKAKKIGGKDGFEVVSADKPTKLKGKRKLTEGDLALGSMLIQSKKLRRDIVDGAWNRYAFNDNNLPDWFVEDEKKHMKKDVPVPKELVDDYKKRVQDINVRPIKKVMEAKARKKQRALRKLERAKKKVEAVMDNTEISDREKARQVKALYKKATKEPKKEVTYVVAKKHMAQKRSARPAGVKGRYKIVDPRMKKDLRAQKAKEKTKGRGKKSRGGKPSRGKRSVPKGKKAK